MPPYTERIQLRSPAKSVQRPAKSANAAAAKNPETGVNGISKKSAPQFKVETVSCYRSSGSVCIPRPAPLHFNSFLPPVKKKKPEPPLKNAQVSTVDVDANEEATPLTDAGVVVESVEAAAVVVVDEIDEKVENIFQPKILFCDPETTATDESEDSVPDLPKPEEPKKVSNGTGCRKHSRCHCNLFSQETDGFFAVQPSK